MNQDEIKNESTESTFTTSEVAKMLHISDVTMLRWLKAEKIPGFFRVGRRWLIRKSDFETFINRRVIGENLINNQNE